MRFYSYVGYFGAGTEVQVRKVVSKMAYDDRDYFQSRPRMEFATTFGRGATGLLIAVATVYLVGIVVGDTSSVVDQDFLRAAVSERSGAWTVYSLFVLTPGDVAVWIDRGIAPAQPWKVLTHWLLPPSMFTALLDCVLLYFVGRTLESLFGTRRFVLLFAGFGIAAGLMSGLVDPLLVPDRSVVISGPAPAIMGFAATFIWIAPEQRSIFGWRLKNVTLLLLAVIVGMSLASGVFSDAGVVQSPTHTLFGILAAAGYMAYLKSRGAVPAVATRMEPERESWKDPAIHDAASDHPSIVRRKERALKAAQRKAAEEAAEKARVDEILDKVSREGVNSLSRKERNILDDWGKKKKSAGKDS